MRTVGIVYALVGSIGTLLLWLYVANTAPGKFDLGGAMIDLDAMFGVALLVATILASLATVFLSIRASVGRQVEIGWVIIGLGVVAALTARTNLGLSLFCILGGVLVLQSRRMPSSCGDAAYLPFRNPMRMTGAAFLIIGGLFGGWVGLLLAIVVGRQASRSGIPISETEIWFRALSPFLVSLAVGVGCTIFRARLVWLLAFVFCLFGFGWLNGTINTLLAVSFCGACVVAVDEICTMVTNWRSSKGGGTTRPYASQE